VPLVELVAAIGLVSGLTLLWRGLRAQRTAARLGGLGTSPIATLAAGEVRVAGTVEAAGVSLTSPILRRACVYHDSRVRSEGKGDPEGWHQTRSIGFFVRDAAGLRDAIRVFPRDAAWDVPTDVDGWADDLGLTLAGDPGAPPADDFDGLSILAASQAPQRRHVSEACLEPGDPVTVVGRALPFADLADPATADAISLEAALGEASPLGLADPEIAADLEAARAAGTLAGDATAAWGNAAIPGFGVGHPVRAPELDPGATAPPPAEPAAAATAARSFEIPPDALVIAAGPGTRLLVAAGSPGQAEERGSDAFLVGLLGAVVAIGSAVALAASLAGRLGP
jgi:hypothetical protein